MQILTKIFKLAIAAIICVAVCPTAGTGQSIWLAPSEKPVISLEMLRPDLKDTRDNVSITSSTWFLSARVPVGEHATLLFELPFVHFDCETESFHATVPVTEHDAENLFGNVYFGVSVHSSDRRFAGQFGIRPPLASEDEDNATAYGFLSDLTRGFDVVVNDNFIINWMFKSRAKKWSDAHLSLQIGSTLFLPTEEGPDPELMIDYGAQLWLTPEIGRFGMGITGRGWVTAERGNAWDNSIHQFGFTAALGFGRLWPGIHLRFPLDDVFMTGFPTGRYSYGIHLSVELEP
jgi:hypothetical protein